MNVNVSNAANVLRNPSVRIIVVMIVHPMHHSIVMYLVMVVITINAMIVISAIGVMTVVVMKKFVKNVVN